MESFDSGRKNNYCDKKMMWIIIKCMLFIGIILVTAFSFGLAVSKNKDKIIQKYKAYFRLMSEWMDLFETENDFRKYLERNGVSRIAVFGANIVGWHFVKQINHTDKIVQYMIDRSALADRVNSLPIYRPEDNLPVVDVVIVTPIWDFDRIKEQMAKQVTCPVISLEELILEVKNG